MGRAQMEGYKYLGRVQQSHFHADQLLYIAAGAVCGAGGAQHGIRVCWLGPGEHDRRAGVCVCVSVWGRAPVDDSPSISPDTPTTWYHNHVMVSNTG